MISPSSQRTERYAVLWVVLILLFGLKLGFNPGLGRNSLDGDYYYQVARHVAEGDGLVTSVSLYHQGLKQLPQKTNISPLWPLLLGWVGRMTNLQLAALILPEALFFLDLILLYVLANRLFESSFGRREILLLQDGVTLDLGHAAVLLLGFNRIFFEFTSLPYTEGLAFCFLLATLLAVDRAEVHRSWPWGAAAGLLAAAAFMTRVQMIAAVVAVPLAFGLGGLRRRRFLGIAGVAAAASVLAVVPWALFLASFVEPFGLRAMLALGAHHQTPEVEPFRSRAVADGLGQYLYQRLIGLGVAFSPWNPNSYVTSFGLSALIVPIAGVGLLARWRSTLAGLRSALAHPPIALTATLLTGAGMLASIHEAHFTFFKEWLFGFRHGLPLILLLIPALAYLVCQGTRAVRWLTLGLLVASLLTGSFAVARMLGTRFASGLLGAEPELVAWLDSHSPTPVVLTTNAQTLSVFSRSKFHWMECKEPPEQTVALVEHVPIDYVLAYPGEYACPYLSVPEGFWEPVQAFGEGSQRIVVLKPR